MPHFHPRAEEIYYILQGRGEMILAHEKHDVVPGDAIAIPPGVPHQIINHSSDPLIFLCCCAPGYEHEDTVMLTNETRATYAFEENQIDT